MNFKIAVLPGDGIGPEISVQGVDVMAAVCKRFGHTVEFKYGIVGGLGYRRGRRPFPERNT